MKNENKLECRVLLAEDCLDSQRLILFYLKRVCTEVVFAENGQVALDLALEAHENGLPFDVILMDIQMPVLGGYEATKKLREAEYTGPIIAITGYASQYDRDSCIDAGCDDYITKPADPNKLVDLIEQYTSEQKQKIELQDTVIM